MRLLLTSSAGSRRLPGCFKGYFKENIVAIQQTEHDTVPYQLLDAEGNLVGEMPDLSHERMLFLYRSMQLGRAYSNKIIALQRQGRATTFGSLVGQEATAESRCLPIQIVIGTQMLHAVGLAMAAKIAGDPVVAVGVCGDGATSEGDFNEALNFAGVFQAPVVLVVQNNGWAISVPRHRQSAAATLAARGAGFGVPSRLVDGNDILAVYAVMQQAIESARAGHGPMLVETLTYRIGAHTTADDPTRYRDAAEVEAWRAKDPIVRFQRFLVKRDLLDEEQDRRMVEEVEEEVNEAVRIAEAMDPPAPDGFFDWMFAELSPRLQEQREDLLRFVDRDKQGGR